MSYLHPNHFTSQKTLESRPSVIFRLVGWGSAHDILYSQKGIQTSTINEWLSDYTNLANVYISSESKISDKNLKELKKIPTNEFHSYLSRASLVITDSQTTATESALLGTPVVRCNSWVGKNDFTNFIELEKKYKLLYNIKEDEQALRFGLKILRNYKLFNSIHRLRLQKLLRNKIDVSGYVYEILTSSNTGNNEN